MASMKYPDTREKKAGTRKKKAGKRGPKPKWTMSTVKPLLARMVEGNSLLDVCRERAISYGSVWQAIHADDEMAEMYARTKNDYVHARVAEMDEIARTEPDVQRARLRCDNIKWESARVAPKAYGDRTMVAGDPDNPLRVEYASVPRADDPETWARMVAEQRGGKRG
ncbi:MAG: hypothetical protein L0H73_13265 [Nitrococcus sp.]|nr:hypothetical protein [Nitrococcus sp.]